MKTLLTALTVFISGTSLANEKEGYYKGLEIPTFTVNEKIDTIEIRTYQPQIIAEVSVTGSRSEAANKGFKIIAKYIFGDNSTQKTVSMTAPVEQKQDSTKISMTSPVTQVEQGTNWVIQFTMPKSYSLETLPKAKDDRIKIKVSKPKNVVAIQFTGLWTDSSFNENKVKLENFMKERNIKPHSKPSFAYYDDPFTLPWNRRNEIHVEIKK